MEQDRLELFRKIPHMLLGLLYFFIYMWLGYSIPFVIGSIFFSYSYGYLYTVSEKIYLVARIIQKNDTKR